MTSISRFTLVALAAVSFLGSKLPAQEATTAPNLIPTSLDTVETRDATAKLIEEKGNPALEMTLGPTKKFSNVRITAPNTSWDLSAFGGVEASVINKGSDDIKLGMRVDNPLPATAKAWNQTTIRLSAGESKTVKLPFGTSYGKPGYALDTSAVSAVLFYMGNKAQPTTVVLTALTPYGNAESVVSAETAKGNKIDNPILYDFTTESSLEGVKGLDSTYEFVDHEGGKALKVVLGTEKPYPNITFTPPNGPIDLSSYDRVEFDVVNLGDESIKIASRVDNPNATGRSNSNTEGITLDPGQAGTIIVKFDRYFAEDLKAKLTGMHYTPWGMRGEWGGRINPANIERMNIFMGHPHKPQPLLVTQIRAAGEFNPEELNVPKDFFPFVDKYGQYIHQDWPGKVKSNADLDAVRQAEAKSINEFPRPEDWNKYGGWKNGPKLEAKGNFYTAKHDGKWFLVDPEGCLFFSIGMDCVGKANKGGGTPIQNRDGWFQNPPWENEPEYAEFKDRTNSKSIYRGELKGQELDTYDFYAANLKRKYGEDWQDHMQEIAPKRLMNWGFNTMGNWSDASLFKDASIPYTHWVHYWAPSKLPRQPGTRNPIPDPFDPTLVEVVTKRAQNMTRGTTDDPFCIGYFIDNELSWGHETYLATATLKAGPEQYAKQAFVEDLKSQYGEVSKLNSAWGTDYASWDAVLDKKIEVAPKTLAAEQDLASFNEKLVDLYFKKMREAIKQVAPDKLYLGCRFAEYNKQVVAAAGKYCDIVSFNLYRGSVAAWNPPVPLDKPVIIGEFHFGASDRGVFGRGLQGADTTEERAEKYLNYVLSAAKNPILVGTHYFLMVDEPVSGRIREGENHGIGFLSITDTPYQEMIDASRKAAMEVYKVRTSKGAVASNP